MPNNYIVTCKLSAQQKGLCLSLHYNKSVFSILRELATRHCSHLVLSVVLLQRPAAAAVDRYCLPAGPTAANPPHTAAAVDR